MYKRQDLHIYVAFLGASSSDPAGNASGYSRSEHAKSICGSLGYAKPDAQDADKVVIITDDLVDYPNTPNSISEHETNECTLPDSCGTCHDGKGSRPEIIGESVQDAGAVLSLIHI